MAIAYRRDPSGVDLLRRWLHGGSASGVLERGEARHQAASATSRDRSVYQSPEQRPVVRFSLITGTKGPALALPRLLDSLVAQGDVGFELLVVDQNDDDRIARILDPYRSLLDIRHLRSPQGLSRARNTALPQSRFDVIAFPDDDCWYAPNTLRQVAALFAAHPHLDFLTGRTVDEQGRDSVSIFHAEEADVTRWNYMEMGNSNCLFFRRHVFEVVGGFDERLGVGAATPFQSGDESDFLVRCVEQGLKGRFFPQLLVYHEQVTKKAVVGEVARSYAYGLGLGALLRKRGHSHLHLLYRALRPLTRAAISMVEGNRVLARKKLNSARGIIRGYRLWDELQDTIPDPEASYLRSRDTMGAHHVQPKSALDAAADGS